MRDRLSLGQRCGGGGRRDPCNPCRGTITMLIIGVFLNIVGLGIVCWALFALATHALPFFVGVTGGFTHFRPGQVRSVSSSLASLRPVSHSSSGGTLSQWPVLLLSALSSGCYWRFLRHAPATMQHSPLLMLGSPRVGGGKCSPFSAPSPSGAPPGRPCLS